MSIKKKVSKPKPAKDTSKTVVARSEDGGVQITFTIPYEKISNARKKAALELGKNIELPGFRKGKAPLQKLISHIPENTLLEKTLSSILPKYISGAINKYKIKPAIHPKFELVKAKDNEDWQIRANTAEIPEFKLGDYKKKVSGSLRAKSLWKPGSGKEEKGESLTREQKEQEVISALLESIKITIPKMLIDEEVNSRLSKLLERIEKLGLNLESYLASIKKTADQLRKEYEKQSKDVIKLDIILARIAIKENIKIDPKQIDEAIKVSSTEPDPQSDTDSPEKRRLIETILMKRAALNSLISLT